MSVARKFIISLALVLMFVSQMPDVSASYDDTELTVTISDTEVQIGDILVINAVVNTTEPLMYQTARIIISSFDTGYIVLTANINMTSQYASFVPNETYSLSLEYDYTPERPIIFGEYTLWMTVGNISAFNRFTISPSLSDLYDDIGKLQEANEIADSNYWYAIKLVYPAAFIISLLTIIACYYLWRYPNSNKEELKYWLLSKGDVNKLKFIKEELRDLDKIGYATRNSPAVGRNESAIKKLNNNLRVMENLKKYTDKRVERMEKMAFNAKEFSTTLQETVDSLSNEITTRNRHIENALSAIEVEAQKVNKKMKKEPIEKRFDSGKFRKMMERRRDEQ